MDAKRSSTGTGGGSPASAEPDAFDLVASDDLAAESRVAFTPLAEIEHGLFHRLDIGQLPLPFLRHIDHAGGSLALCAPFFWL